jgi:hypothetical protein
LAAPEVVIAITLKIKFFFEILSASVLLFRESSFLFSHKKLNSEAAKSECFAAKLPPPVSTRTLP